MRLVRWCHRCGIAEYQRSLRGGEGFSTYAFEANANYQGRRLVIETGVRLSETPPTCGCGDKFTDENELVALLTHEEQDGPPIDQG